jgi:hypothetical protein
MKHRTTLLHAAADWLVILCLIALFIGVDQIYPVVRPFSLTDESLMYPFIQHGNPLPSTVWN